MEDHINGTSLTQPKYDPKSHQMVYSMTNDKGEVTTMSMADINKGLTAHDPEYLKNVASKFTNAVAMGKGSKDGQFTVDDAIRFKNDLNKSITSWDEVRNVAKERWGNMKHSFEEVLMGQAKDANGNVDTTLLRTLYDELDAIGTIDITGDGRIDSADEKKMKQMSKDYTNPENLPILMDALSKDKQKYKELMTGYLTETVVKDFYWQQGVDQRPKETSGLTAGQQQTNRQKNEAYNTALKAYTNKPGTTLPGWDGKTAKLEKDDNDKWVWYTYDKNGKLMDMVFPYTKEAIVRKFIKIT